MGSNTSSPSDGSPPRFPNRMRTGEIQMDRRDHFATIELGVFSNKGVGKCNETKTYHSFYSQIDGINSLSQKELFGKSKERWGSNEYHICKWTSRVSLFPKLRLFFFSSSSHQGQIDRLEMFKVFSFSEPKRFPGRPLLFSVSPTFLWKIIGLLHTFHVPHDSRDL